MNNEERYYVPTIEEFCIGFEFEYRPFDSQNRVYVEHWVKKTFKAIGNLDRWQDKYLRDGVVRVKRLDREDIEYLGWRFIKNGTTLFGAIPTQVFERKGYVFTLCKDWVSIYEEDNEYVFKGQIANKHELKVLMKQLGI